jgi:hypothetical protein
MSKNLIELMAKQLMAFDTGIINGWNVSEGWEKELFLRRSAEILSCVKEHIGEVAEVCPDCVGEGIVDQEFIKSCGLCKGYGVTARTEGDV